MPSDVGEAAQDNGAADGPHHMDLAPSPEDVLAALQVGAAQLREAVQALERRRQLREANLQPSRPGEEALKKADSSVRRNTALVKKLRAGVSEDAREALLEEVSRTNLSKYTSEAQAALVDAPLKLRDVPAAAAVACALHQRYADFGPQLAAALALALLAGEGEAADGDKAGMARRRSWLRLLGELCALGAAEPQLLAAPLAALAGECGRGGEATHAAVPVLAAFAKAAREELLGLPPQLPSIAPGAPQALAEEGGPEQLQQRVAELRQALEQEQAARACAPPQLQTELRETVGRAFDGAAAALAAEHAALLELEQQQREARRALSGDAAAAYEAQRRAFDSLEKAAASLGDALGRQLPKLEAPGTTRLRPAATVAILSAKEPGPAGPFEDEQQRAFYESLPDLASLVPALLLGKGAEARVDTGSPEEPSSPAGPAPQQLPAAGEGGAESRAAVLQHAAAADSQEAADEAAVELCFAGGKGARRRLVRLLTAESSAALHQLPFHARILATLAQAFPDVGSQALAQLEADCARLQAKKDGSQRTLDERLRNARLLAELAKFRVCPPNTFFTLLKDLLDDFSGHSVDAAAAMVEAAGRFLLLQPESAQRMANLLEVMLRLKNGRNLDSRQALAVDAAHAACRPRARASQRAKQRPPQQLFLRHLVHTVLALDTVKQVTRKLRKFPWAETEAPLVRCLLAGVRARFADAPLLASLAAGLSRYRPSLGVALADALMEEIRLSLEAPESGDFQRQVGHLRLLGELYNYRLVDSRTVFDTLYLLLAWGHETPERAARYDPPESAFRARLTCTLLAACGGYFSKGAAARRLDRFLAYFQRYLLHKPALPLDVEFDVQELWEALRPQKQRAATFEEACREVEALEAAEAATAAAGAAATPEDSERGDESPDEWASDDEREAAEPEVAQEEEAVASGGDDEEEAAVRVRRPRRQPEIDEDFERELAALTLAPPAAGGAPAAAAVRAPPVADDGGGPGETVAFRVMLRKGGRDDKTRAIQVPASLALAVRSREELAADAAERAEMKRLVLEASAREDAAAAAAVAAAKARRPRGGVRIGAGQQRSYGSRYQRSQLPPLAEDT